ncbi:hypothetical protein LF41_308 [Lysobacter dokdonensis DS-58]|uniref:Uncharacterized protein n=1 Tax=Lysobacter dokdonensis DS-58 TaxID=1300345 RepID=A0A0A2WKI1_9GAMM|nr:hypothetical protein LF41_308 [Lysobacter dokdonensis DS-58]
MAANGSPPHGRELGAGLQGAVMDRCGDVGREGLVAFHRSRGPSDAVFSPRI